MPIPTRAQPPRVPARADVQRQGPGRCGGFGGAPFRFYTTMGVILATGCRLPSCRGVFEARLWAPGAPEKSAGDRGWSAGDQAARETTHPCFTQWAIWLNLPEEQADLKD